MHWILKTTIMIIMGITAAIPILLFKNHYVLTCISSLNPHNNSINKHPHFRDGKTWFREVKKFSKVTQEIRSKGRVRICVLIHLATKHLLNSSSVPDSESLFYIFTHYMFNNSFSIICPKELKRE